MGCVYIISMYSLPVLLLISLFVDGWTKFWTISLLFMMSCIVLFVKVQWAKQWKEVKKHGVALSGVSVLGASPIHAMFTILSVIGFIYSWIWMLLDSHDLVRLIINLSFLIIFVIILILLYKTI